MHLIGGNVYWYANDDSKQPLSPDFLRQRKQYYNKLAQNKAKQDYQLRRRVVLCLSTWKVCGDNGVTYSKIADMLEASLNSNR